MLTFNYMMGLLSVIVFSLVSIFVNHWGPKDESPFDRIYSVVSWGIGITGSFIAGSFMGTWVSILVLFITCNMVVWFAYYIYKIEKENR